MSKNINFFAHGALFKRYQSLKVYSKFRILSLSFFSYFNLTFAHGTLSYLKPKHFGHSKLSIFLRMTDDY